MLILYFTISKQSSKYISKIQNKLKKIRHIAMDPEFPENCNYAGSLMSNAFMISRCRGVVSVKT